MILNNTKMLDASAWTMLRIGIYPIRLACIIVFRYANVYLHVQHGMYNLVYELYSVSIAWYVCIIKYSIKKYFYFFPANKYIYIQVGVLFSFIYVARKGAIFILK